MANSNQFDLKSKLWLNQVFLLFALLFALAANAFAIRPFWDIKVSVFYVPSVILVGCLVRIMICMLKCRKWLKKHTSVLWITGHCFASIITFAMTYDELVYSRPFAVTALVLYLAVLAGGYIQNPVPSSFSAPVAPIKLELPSTQVQLAKQLPLASPESSVVSDDEYTPSHVTEPQSPAPLLGGSKPKPKSSFRIWPQK